MIKISIQYSGEYVFMDKNIAYFKYKPYKLLKNEYFYVFFIILLSSL